MSSRISFIKRRIASATKRREHHLMQALTYDEKIDQLKQELAKPVSEPLPSKKVPSKLRDARGLVHNAKLREEQIPEVIETLDTGIGWRATATKFDLKPQSLKERVYRYLIDQQMLTDETVKSIWRDTSYKYLARIYGQPVAE